MFSDMLSSFSAQIPYVLLPLSKWIPPELAQLGQSISSIR